MTSGSAFAPIAAALLLGAATAGAAGSDGLKAWLEPVPRGNVVAFQGYVTAPEPMVVRYRLRIMRIGSGGRSATSQGGQVQIMHPDEPTPLSLTAINVGRGDSYEAELIATGPGGEEVRVQLSRDPN